MKKAVAAIMLLCVIISFAGCSQADQWIDSDGTATVTPTGTSNDNNNYEPEFLLTAEMVIKLAENGVSEEEFASLPKQEQEALLRSLGFGPYLDSISGNQTPEKEDNTKPAKATLQDVENGGDWIVKVGDVENWNYMELHYKDGKLWKIVCHFQKDLGEEAEIEVIEGEEEVAKFAFYFIDYTQSVTTLVPEIQSKLYYTKVTIKSAT